MEFILSGLLLGLITSFHCVGMCGPIAIALPLHGNTKAQKLLGGVLYNLGRTLTYMVMGVIFGMIGQSLGSMGFQRWVSIVTGLLMISTVFFPSMFTLNLGVKKKGFSLVNQVKLGLRKLFSTKSYISLFFIGLLNGFLPCGPLYSALIISTGTGHVVSSVMFMMMFGLGTIPLLLLVTILGNFISIKVRNKVSKTLPYIIFFIGVLFILRGLNLGIPFLSPTTEMIKMKAHKTKQKVDRENANYQMEKDSMNLNKEK